MQVKFMSMRQIPKPPEAQMVNPFASKGCISFELSVKFLKDSKKICGFDCFLRKLFIKSLLLGACHVSKATLIFKIGSITALVFIHNVK
jgi:hypothetical protein